MARLRTFTHRSPASQWVCQPWPGPTARRDPVRQGCGERRVSAFSFCTGPCKFCSQSFTPGPISECFHSKVCSRPFLSQKSPLHRIASQMLEQKRLLNKARCYMKKIWALLGLLGRSEDHPQVSSGHVSQAVGISQEIPNSGRSGYDGQRGEVR